MDTFTVACCKNFTKLSLITIAALASTLGLRTELTIILNDIAMATWIAIGWVFVIISVIAYYKAKQDVELIDLREFKDHRRTLGMIPLPDKPPTNNVPSKAPVFLQETK